MPWKESITPADVVAFLNELLEIDPAAVRALFEIRVTCGEDLAKHPTVQVESQRANDEDYNDVGLLGVLNGLLGVDATGRGPIRSVYVMSNLQQFELTPAPVPTVVETNIEGKLGGCWLTIDVQNNRHARAAAYAYVESITGDDPTAAQALRTILDGLPPIPLAPWQQELVDEYEALNERRRKLTEFFNSDAVRAMTPEERRDLCSQQGAMDSYARAIAARIARFNT